MDTSWTEVGKKRKPNSPIFNRGKESRNEIDMMSEINEVDGATSTSRRNSTTSQETFASVTSQSTIQERKPANESTFVTKKPEGAFRDEIVVELQTLDDQPFKGKLTTREARITIFETILGFKQVDLASIVLTYSRGQIVAYKLKQPFNIDELKNIEHFELERPRMVRGEERNSILKCKIRGIRTGQRADGESYSDTGMRWVKIEGCEFRVSREQMIEWMSFFGEVKSDVTEDMFGGSDDSADDLPPVGNGIYSVKMKIERDMPQFIPMYGKRVRLYYRGIVKRCTNCFRPHQRSQCKNEKVTWAEYVGGFAEIFPDIPHVMYGKWSSMIKNTTVVTQQTTQPSNEPGETLVQESESEMANESQQVDEVLVKKPEKKKPNKGKKSTVAEREESEDGEETGIDEE